MMVRVTVEQALSAALKDIKTRLDRVERRSFSALGLTEHNGLGGIQGGALTERYHLDLDQTSRLLTAEEYAAMHLTATVVTGDNFQAIQDAIDSCPTGGTVFIPRGTYSDEGVSQINVNKAITIRGEGATTLLYQTATACKVFEVTASYVNIVDLSIRGPQYTVYQSDYGIRVMGAIGAGLTNFHIENCRMFNFGHTALWMQYITEFSVINCEVYFIQRSGILALSGIDGLIHGNHVHDLNLAVGNPNHYPIMVSRDSLQTLANSPRSENIVISSNKVEGADWEAIETHGGKDIAVVGNTIRDCKIGVAMVPCPDNSVPAIDTYAPLNCTVVGNMIDSQVTDGSKQVGIKFVGCTNSPVDGGSLELATGTIVGNLVTGHGTQSSSLSGAIQVYGTKGMSIVGNTIINPSPVGISLYHTNLGVSIANNVIMDAWSDSYSHPMGIGLMNFYNECFIGGNVIDTTYEKLAGKTYYLDWGVYAASDVSNKISWGQNRITGYGSTEAYLVGNASSTHSFTGMALVANDTNPMFGLGRATADTGFAACTNAGTGAMAFRTLTAGTNITITNPDGILGDPVINATGTGTVDLTGTTGVVVQTGSSTYVARSVAQGGGITVTNGSGVAGNPTVAATLTGSTGMVAQTGTSTFSARTITAGTGIVVGSGNGVAGNPTISFSEYGSWTSFTPDWYAISSNPSLGNATVSAFYKQLDAHTLQVSINITMGSTTTYGSGNWYFGVPGFSLSAIPPQMGSGLVFDTGTATYQCVPFLSATDRIYVMSGTAGAQSYCAAGAPFTWTTGDIMRFSITCRV